MFTVMNCILLFCITLEKQKLCGIALKQKRFFLNKKGNYQFYWVDPNASKFRKLLLLPW